MGAHEPPQECDPSNSSHLCTSSPGQVPQLIAALLSAALVKGALTVVTFGIKVPAGIFIPSLGVGALIGRAMGIFVEYLQEMYPKASIFGHCSATAPFGQRCIIPGVWAICGAVGGFFHFLILPLQADPAYAGCDPSWCDPHGFIARGHVR